MATVVIEQPFTVAEAAAALEHEAVFVSRNPQLLLRSERHFIIFRNGEYRTSDLAEIEFLLGVVKDEARANRGVEIRKLPTARAADGRVDAAALTHETQRPTEVVLTPPSSRRRRGPDRVPRRRSARKQEV